MDKQNIALLLNCMEAQRKGGGFQFDIMPLAAQTVQRLSDLFNQMGDADVVVLMQAQTPEKKTDETEESKPEASKKSK